MTDLNLIEDQKLWEMDGVERGVRRYRKDLQKSLQSGAEAETPPGERMMLAIMKELVPAIEREQENGVAMREGAPYAWALPLNSLSSEKWALIAARTALSFARSERPLTQVALGIANAGRNEVEFENFKKAEAAKAKRDDDYVSLFDRMSRKMKTFSPRTVRKWMKKCEAFEKAEWSKSEKLQVGSLLAHILVTDVGGWFEHRIISAVSRGVVTTTASLSLTPNALDFLNTQHAQSELTRPWMLPMICQPNDWRSTHEAE